MSEGVDCGRGDRDFIEAAFSRFRTEIGLKHTQNRSDIHALEKKQDALRLEMEQLRGRMEPYLDNGQPGLFSRMSTKLDGLISQVTDIRVAQGADAGRRDVYGWMRAVVASIIVGVLIVVAQHLWK